MRAVIPLAVAFLAAIAAFIGSTMLAQHAARSIDEDAVLISRDAAPGVEAIAGARAEMRLLQTLVVRRASGDGVKNEEIASTRARVDERMATAIALPVAPEEGRLLASLETALRAFDSTAERVLEQVRVGRLQDAQRTAATELRSRAAEADSAASLLVDYDAHAAQAAAERIEAERERVNRLAWELDALSAVFALLAAIFALRAMRQVQQAQDRYLELAQRKAAELEQFAGRVAHDVLSPLSTVGLAFSIANRSAAPQARDALARGEASLHRVRGIVDGLLDFARSGARPDPLSRAEVAPVVEGLRDELAVMAEQQAAMLVFEPFEACAVACSPGVLMSLLSNLLRNALKYLGDAQVRRVTLRVRPRRAGVLFEVEDTGPGVPAELGNRIFEPYIRGRHPGVAGIGLGLATVQRLVQAHGGTVGVRPAPAGGALFWFELPVSESPGVRLPAPEARQA